MKRVLLISCLVITGLFTTSCSSFVNWAERVSFNVTNKSAEISCYSGGKEIMKTTTKGKVTDDANSDGFYFQSQDGLFYEITGDCVFKYIP